MFDIIGDVHGCYEELCALLERLGYDLARDGSGAHVAAPPGRTALFLGDLADRGPRNPEVIELVMDMADAGVATCVQGNHEHQFLRHLEGTFPLGWGLEQTMEQLADRPPELVERWRRFAADLPHQLTLDAGHLIVAHAGLPEEFHEVDSPRARQFTLYGTPEGTQRAQWVPSYRGAATVVYGHTPTESLAWVNGTICIDTGCVYGGRLTALRYPELELVSVEAKRRYFPGA